MFARVPVAVPGPRPSQAARLSVSGVRLALLAMPGLLAPAASLAADAGRGARLFLQRPGDVPTCVDCHGADPAASRNNLLRAADQPAALQKALGTVSAMGFLRPALTEADVADLAAYLGGVSRLQASTAVAVWPRTVEFGGLQPGAASASAQVTWLNLATRTVAAPMPRLVQGRFVLDSGCRDPLPPGGSCTVSLRAVAGAAGDLTDVLGFAGDADVLIGVSARVRADPAAVWSAEFKAVDFGTVEPGQSVERRVLLRNVGTSPGLLGAATLTGPGVASFDGHEGCGNGVPVWPGQSCTLSLRFRPGAAGLHRATVQWRADGAHPSTVTLQGVGARAVAGPSDPPPAGQGGGGGGGGCAAAPAARTGDASLWLWALAAVAGLWRPRIRRQ